MCQKLRSDSPELPYIFG